MIHVCAPVYYEDARPARHLITTANSFGVEVNIYGLGEKWGYYRSKIEGLRRHLENVHSEYVLFLDATDSVFVGGEKEIMKAYEKVRDGKDIVLQATHTCWPHIILKAQFDEHQKRGHPYPCSGCVMGKRDAVFECLDAIMAKHDACPSWIPYYEVDDQGWWMLAYANNWADITLDNEAMLSLCIHMQKLVWFKQENGHYGMYDHKPPILHFAGPKCAGTMRAWLQMQGIR